MERSSDLEEVRTPNRTKRNGKAHPEEHEPCSEDETRIGRYGHPGLVAG